MAEHVPEDNLELYSLGRLPKEKLAPLEEHILVCEHCRERLKEIEDYIAVAKAATRELESDS